MKSWAALSLAKPNRFSALMPPLKLFNTASDTVEELAKKDLYRLYVCGITPYDATHLGHAATYVTFDLINRYLRFSGAEVKFVENITDIDDPLLERAVRDNVDWKELALSQIELFRGDMVALHVIPPDFYVGVVEAMDVIIDSISQLQEKGALYKVENDLYFRVRLDPQFLRRTHLSPEVAMQFFGERGGDPKREGKEDPFDALVWRAERPGEPAWPSPFGMGRPGWHIECSAIALHFLKPEISDEFAIDIQGGGSDLIFPHHDMSAAQGFIATGQKFARSYVHAGMIGLDGSKMSKSLGNLIFVSKLINEGVDPIAIRLALFGHHYRRDHMWGSHEIAQATAFLDRLRRNLARPEVAETDPVITEILSCLSNDLDTCGVISTLEQWCERTEKGYQGGSPGELSRILDDLLGLAL
ncbi:MAG: cysteine--1-D-myo-inosityl 2-amino-2-deoxy-alpha-D-glucopyranoside ligase [Candidatus Planktophila sp.]